ncbi:MAG: site-specific DNA-methyltransferase [Candidatus Thermoplasmatota archaeon]|nr:site-specific DNA-methyltransferase [Candidatus Thermoplasmatota archaeon]
MTAPASRVIIADSRDMGELGDGSIQLMVTSPPYWHIKDYGTSEQIGYGQSLHEYLIDLYRVWEEVFRVLEDGRRACINIGDQFTRASQYGRYKVVPLHAEIILQMEKIGFDFMGSIIWNKRTSMKTSGGANIMGSYPYPPNGIVEIDYEHIMVFRKPGKIRKFDTLVKGSSKLTKEEWKEYHLSHWNFGGARQRGHEAMFPEELPKRLIRMFSLEGETVLDPFLGSGTTAMAARKLGRGFIGYEINPDFIPVIRKKIVTVENWDMELVERSGPVHEREVDHRPSIKDISPMDRRIENAPRTHRVKGLSSDLKLEVQDIGVVRLMGIDISDRKRAAEYLERYVVGKHVLLRDMTEDGSALVYLSNRIHVNKELVKRGAATVRNDWDHPAKRILLKAQSGSSHS